MAKQSVTINFVTQSLTDSGIELIVDMDDEKNKTENNDRTSNFLFGDTAYFRVFTNPISGVNLDLYESDGTLGSYGIKQVLIEDEYLIFEEPPSSTETNKTSLDKPVYSGFSASKVSPGTGSVSVNPVDPTEAICSIAGPAVFKANYTAQYHSFSINMPSIPAGHPVDDPYPIVIVIVGS